MSQGSLFIISAPSGVGKTSLCRALLKRLPELALSVSYTTRHPRPSEVEGLHYHFVDRLRFETHLKAGDFLEHAQVFDHYYGTARAWVEATCAQGLDVILEIDWQGAKQIKEQWPSAQSIFIIPPSFSVLTERLAHRHPEDPDLVASRLKNFLQDMVHYPDYDYLVCNDDFEGALLDLCAIIRADRLSCERQCRIQAARLQALLVGA
jgi:guanylate kinase